MKHEKYIVKRIAKVKCFIRLLESAFTTPRQYLELQVLLFGDSRITWADDESEGREIIENFALNNKVIGESCFTICFAANGKIYTLVDCDKGKGVICSILPNGLKMLLAIADSKDIKALTGHPKAYIKTQCSFEYKTNGNNTDFVELIRETAEPKTIYHCRIKRITEITGITIYAAQLDREKLREYCAQRTPIWQLRIYGVEHSDRVAANGQRLLVPGANLNVITAFAYLHDAERNNSETDPGHGNRAALLVDRIRNQYLTALTDTEIDLLKEACSVHSDTHGTGNPTIDICLDADRLDLPRLGIIPNPEQMATEQGARIAEKLAE